MRISMQKLRAFRLFVVVSLLSFGLSACIPAIIGLGASTGYVLVQERSAGDAIDDIGIAAQIKHAYLNKDIDDLYPGVSVEVIEGRVHLTGKVKKSESRIDAVRLAWQPKGVKEVINEIIVTDKPREISNIVTDNWIVAQLDSELLFTSNVLSFNYSTDVVNGVVYIMGIAKDEDELDTAISVAQSIRGVKKVITHVRMRGDKG